MDASIVAKMVIDHTNVRNRKKPVAAVLVVEKDQVSYSLFEDEHYDEISFLDACFNCGQEGHRSYECTEPKKAGGGGGGGGGQSSKFSLNGK
jgi:hypothetical protein